MEKKSLLFVMKYPLDTPYNIKMKFDGQMEAAGRLGYDVYHIAWDNRYLYLVNGGRRSIIKKAGFTKKGWYIHTKAFIDIYISVRRVLKKQSFDFVYMRNSPLDFFGWRMLSALHKKGSRVVVEIPTYPPESEHTPSALRRFVSGFSRFFWKMSADYIDQYALIGIDTPDIYRGKPAVSIENGVSVESVPLRAAAVHAEEVHILALASMCNWHGYDRLIAGLAEYKGDVPVVIHMVGGDGDGSLAKWKLLAGELGVQDRVAFEGPLYGETLTGMFSKCDIGVESLGWYRKGFACGYGLKLREYMARGLPFVYAVDDPGLETAENEKRDYTLKIPNDGTAVDMTAVVNFALSCKSNPALPAAMRQYADRHMSWKQQMKKAFAMLEEPPR